MQTWISTACQQTILFRAIKIAGVVGTLLMIINHGDRLIAGAMEPIHWLKVILTYLVPYFVSTYSSLATYREQ